MAAKPRKSMKLFPLETVKPMKPTQGLPRTQKLPATSTVTGSPATVPGFKAAPGRPQSNVGQYLIKPTIQDKSGFEMVNDKPAAIEQVKENYLKKWELPPALQPKYLRKPEVMEQQRTKAISKGFVKPRSRIQ
jgi:hypothetical protein